MRSLFKFQIATLLHWAVFGGHHGGLERGPCEIRRLGCYGEYLEIDGRGCLKKKKTVVGRKK